MSSDFDASEFVDDDFRTSRQTPQSPQPPAAAPSLPAATGRAPSREEVDSKVGEMQQKLAELKRVQQELERERASLEETRRRQMEFTSGRQEMQQHLTRGVGLLEETEFSARRDSEQMAKALIDLREALVKVESVREEAWTKDNFNVELTRALTIIENARMEWNTARLKFPILSGEAAAQANQSAAPENALENLLRQKNYAEICKLGLALTWPLALAGLAIFLVLLTLLLRMK